MQDIVDARAAGELESYWEDDTQDLYHQSLLDEQQQLETKMQSKYEIKPGNISLFKNDKGDNEKRPDYTGSMKTPDGVELQVSMWFTESQNGLKYMSGKVQEPYSTAIPYNMLHGLLDFRWEINTIINLLSLGQP